MALVSVKRYEGMGNHYLQRVIGFAPNDPEAVTYAAEQLAERIGAARGGDGYGYPLDYGEGPGWIIIDVHGPEDGRAVITLDWYPTEPATPCRIVQRWEYSGKRYWSCEDDDGRRWTYGPLDTSMARWEVGESESDPEHWIVELADAGDTYDRELIKRARHEANYGPNLYGGRLYGLPEVIE